MGNFDERMRELDRMVGRGKLTGQVVVDQRYAKFQHESLDLRHKTGRAKYLSGPMTDNHREYFGYIADATLETGPQEGMRKSVEFLAAEVFLQAPVELGDLKRSGQPFVFDNGAQIYHRPPIQRRLTDADLEEKEALRISLGLGPAGTRE